MRRQTLMSAVLVLGFVVAGLGQQLGLSSSDLDAILSQLPPVPPVVYVSLAPQLVATQVAVVVATGSYAVDSNHVRSATVYIFLKTEDVWVQAFATEEDERLAAHHAPGYWEIALNHIEYADMDGDELFEVVIYWNSSPTTAFSLIQYSRIINVVDYDDVAGAFHEITGDQVVYNEFMDDAFLMNVDTDPQTEIVLWEHTRLGEESIMML